jgi:uncharacterized protein (DUF2164 family)
MAIELTKAHYGEAVASLERYCHEKLDLEIGNLAAGGLLDYILKEIAPLVYNQGVADAQEHIHARVRELDAEVFEEGLQYWVNQRRS